MIPLAELYPVLAEKYGDIPEVQQGIVRLAWDYCVGDNIRKASKPVRFENGTLLVRVSDPQWHATLNSMQEEIVAKINKYLKRRLLANLQIESG